MIPTPDGILLSQRHYVLNILYKLGMTECQPVSTPLDRIADVRSGDGQVDKASDNFVGTVSHRKSVRSRDT